MLFKALYQLVCELDEPPVTFDRIRQLVNMHHAGVGVIKVWAMSYPTPNGQAHYKLTGVDRSSAYDEEYDEAEIRYCDSLDGEELELKYALTKELMHVFDSADQRVDTRQKFMKLVREIQNQPLPEDASAMYTSEINAQWMALLILSPMKFRESFKVQNLTEIEIAQKLQVPEWIVPYIMDDYFEMVHQKLVMDA